MAKQFSYTKYESKFIPGFRAMINKSESTEDVKKFFVQATKRLFDDIFSEEIDFEYEDIKFQPDQEPYFKLSNRILSSKTFSSVWNESDLPHVVQRFAGSAIGRYKHLLKSPEKTVSKIRM